MESVEDGDTVLVAGGQYGTGGRYLEYVIGRCLRAFRCQETGMSFPMNGSLTHMRACCNNNVHIILATVLVRKIKRPYSPKV